MKLRRSGFTGALCSALLGAACATSIGSSPRRPDAPAARPTTERVAEPTPEVAGSSFYAAPWGTASGDGSPSRPWDLATALSHAAPLRPGGTIYLRGGTYRGPFTSRLAGTASAPVTLRGAPGERAVIDGAGSPADALKVYGRWAVYRDFEVTNTDPHRLDTSPRPAGIYVRAPHTRLVNLVVHDAGVGLLLGADATDSEVYGLISFNNGASNLHHGIYAGSLLGTQTIADSVFFNNYALGVHLYASRAGSLKGFRLEGNASFNNGSLASVKPNILVGGEVPAERVALVENYTYHRPGAANVNVRLGYNPAVANRDVAAHSNLFAGGSPVLSVGRWARVSFTGNTLCGAAELLSMLPLASTGGAPYEWDENFYCGGNAAAYGMGGQPFDFAGWQRATGFDSRSTHLSGRPAAQVFVRPNRYESGRAHVIVYNWDLRPTVEVDLGRFMPPGAPYEVLNVQNYFAPPVLRGTYDGRPVGLPLGATDVARPTGFKASPPTTAPEFNVFLVRRVVRP